MRLVGGGCPDRRDDAPIGPVQVLVQSLDVLGCRISNVIRRWPQGVDPRGSCPGCVPGSCTARVGPDGVAVCVTPAGASPDALGLG